MLLQGISEKANTIFTFWMIFCPLYFVSCQWFIFLWLLAGNIHRNPGPSKLSSWVSSVSLLSTSMSTSRFSSLNVSHNLSFVHYNVQTILSKRDTFYVELLEFDILAFTETWLSQSNDPTELESYGKPERKS